MRQKTQNSQHNIKEEHEELVWMTLPDFKMYHEVTAVKTGYWQNNLQIEAE